MTFKSCQKSLLATSLDRWGKKNDLNVSNDEYETIECKLEIRQIIALVSTILLWSNQKCNQFGNAFSSLAIQVHDRL